MAKLNKRGVQVKNRVQPNDEWKRIYDVDGSVQIFSEEECAEEAEIDGGVVTNETVMKDPVTNKIVNATSVPQETEEPVAKQGYTKEDKNDLAETIKALDEAVSENHIDDVIELIEDIGNNPAYTCIKYDNSLIKKMHYNLAGSIGAPPRQFKDKDCVTLYANFVNWTNGKYLDVDKVYTALEQQYRDFVDIKKSLQNNPDVPNIYYCNNPKAMTAGCLMSDINLLPVRGNVKRITINIPVKEYDNFIKKYATKVLVLQTFEQVPDHVMSLMAQEHVPMYGVLPCLLINMPLFLKEFSEFRHSIFESASLWGFYGNNEYHIAFNSDDNSLTINTGISLEASSYNECIKHGVAYRNLFKS